METVETVDTVETERLWRLYVETEETEETVETKGMYRMKIWKSITDSLTTWKQEMLAHLKIE